MQAEANHHYPGRIPAAFLVIFITSVVQTTIQDIAPSMPSSGLWLVFLHYFAGGAGILLAIGIVTRSFKNALLSLILYGCIILANIPLAIYVQEDGLTAVNKTFVSLYQYLYLLPFIFFLYREASRHFRYRHLLPLLVIALFRCLYSPDLNSPYSFSDETIITGLWDYVIIFLSYCCNFFVLSMIICFLTFYARDGQKISFRKPDLSDGISQSGRTFLFWGIKGMLLITPVMIAGVMVNIPADSEYDNEAWAIAYLWFNWFVSILSALFLIIIATLALRKIILEFLCRYGLHQRIVYWLTALPVAGFVTWLIILLSRTPLSQIRERADTLEQYKKSSPLSAVLVTLLLFVALSIAYAMATSTYSVTSFLFLFVPTFLIYAYRKKGLYLQLAIPAALLLTNTGFLFFRSSIINTDYSSLGYFGTLLGLLGISWTLLFHPAFQASQFVAEKTGEQPISKDLFADVDL